MYRYR